MNKLFFVLSLCFVTACHNENTNSKSPSSSSSVMTDYQINGLRGKVKKRTAHSYRDIENKDGKWVALGKPYATAITYFNPDGFVTQTELYNYDGGEMKLSHKTVYEFKNGLPESMNMIENDTIRHTRTFQYINDTVCKIIYKNTPGFQCTDELLANGKLFVSTKIFTDSNNIKVITQNAQTYNEKGNISSYTDKRTVTQNGNEMSELGMDYEYNTISGVTAYDKYGNINEEILTTQNGDEVSSEIRKVEYEYYP